MAKFLYLKVCWNKSLLLLIALLLTSCTNKKKNIEFYEAQDCEDIFSTSPALVGAKLSFEDSIYLSVIPEYNIEEIMPPLVADRKRKDVYSMLRKDTFRIQEDFYKSLLANSLLFHPVASIDSIYKGNVTNILTSFFNERGVLDTPLSQEEVLYIVYILFQHRIYTWRDCETGYICIIDFPQ